MHAENDRAAIARGLAVWKVDHVTPIRLTLLRRLWKFLCKP